MDLPIIPRPQLVKQIPGKFLLSGELKIIIIGPEKEKLAISASELKETLKSLGIKSSMVSNEKNGSIFLRQRNDFVNRSPIPADKINEGYTLKISAKKIDIESVSSRGIYYGTMSLIQLLEKKRNKNLPSVEITDWPDLSVRGISDDISRGQVPKMKNFKRIIDFISRYKMNIYMPYIEDMLQFESYPSIGKGRGALSKEEVKEIIEYANKHFIEVIPIFQTLGHYENILTQPEFLKYAEFPGAASLNVSSQETYQFLETLLKEVFEMFPSEYFHMGADESWDVGLGKSKHLVEQSGIADVHAEHYRKVYNICKKYGKKVLMYGDIILNHPEILNKLPKDIIIVDWHYRPQNSYPSTTTFNNAGRQYYVSPSVWNFLSVFPENLNALPNIKNMIKNGLENNTLGMINSNWGDIGAETFKELILFGYAWSAQCSWNFKESTESVFSKNFFYDFWGIDNERSVEIYKTLSVPLSNITWYYFWRHPLLPFPPVNWEGNIHPAIKISWLDWILPELKSKIIQLEKTAIKNKDHFVILRFIVNLIEFYKLKLLTQNLLNDKMNGKNIDVKKVSDLIGKNISELEKLKNNFKTIWIKYYKENNLSMIEGRFDRLIGYFYETADQLKKGTLKSPVIESKWIYHPDSRNKNILVSTATFKKSFRLNEVIKSTYLQLIGNTYAKLFINGKPAGEVYARRSASLGVDYKRILFLNIKRFLIAGKNTIEVVVENYDEKGNAGFNLISEIKTSVRELILISDETWSVKKTGSNDWYNAVSKEYPDYVIAPDFKTKRTSWIEREWVLIN